MGAGTTTTSAPTQPNAPTQPFSYNYLMMLLSSGGYTAKKDLSRPTQLKRGGEGFNYFKEVGQPVDFTTLTPTPPTTPTTTPTTDTPPPTTPPPTTPDTGLGTGSGKEGIFRPDVAGEETPPSDQLATQTDAEEVDYTALQNELNEIAGDLQTDDEAFENYLESDDYVQTTAGTGSTTMDDAGDDKFDTTVTSGDDTPTMDEDQERLDLQDELDRRTYESIIEQMQEDADGEISNQTKIDVATDRINALINSNTPSGSDERRAEEAEIQRLQGIIEDLNGVKNYGDPSSSMDDYLAEIADQDVRDRIKFEDLLARNAEFGEGLLTVREYNNLIQNRIDALANSTMTVTSSQRRAEEAEIKRLQGLTAQDALSEGYAYYVEQYNQFNAPALDLTLGEDIFTLGDPADNPVSPVFTGNPADDFNENVTVISDPPKPEVTPEEPPSTPQETDVQEEVVADTPVSDEPAPNTPAPDAPTPENYGVDSEGNMITYNDRFTYNPDRDYVKYASGEELNDYLLYKQNQSTSNTDLKPYEHFEYEQEDPFLLNNEDYKRHLEWSQNNDNMGEMRYLETMYYRFKTQALSSAGDDEYNKFLSALNIPDSQVIRNNWAAGKGMAVYNKLSRDLNVKIFTANL